MNRDLARRVCSFAAGTTDDELREDARMLLAMIGVHPEGPTYAGDLRLPNLKQSGSQTGRGDYR